MKRLLEHIHRHPYRLLATAIVLVVLSWGLASIAIVRSLDAAHRGRVENCRAVNELSRKIFVTMSDLGQPLEQRLKFLPTENCEKLP